MNTVLKTAGVITSGLIVGAIVHKILQQGIVPKGASKFANAIKNVKDGAKKFSRLEGENEFFI
jgi:hypothetical protein